MAVTFLEDEHGALQGMHPSVLKPKRPTGPGWCLTPHRLKALDALGYPYAIWAHDGNGLGVISAVEVAHDPGQPDLGPEFHLSISAFGKRCSAADALWVLAQFGLTDATEDNHVPGGVVRNFWRPVADSLAGYQCPCVDDEPAVKEDKGDFTWRGVTR